MTNWLCTILLLVFCFFGVQAQKSAASQTQSDLWTEFISKRANFKIRFPEKPVSSQSNENTGESKGTVYWTNVTTRLAYFAVFYSEPILPDREKEDLSADYDFLRDKTAKVKNREIVKESEVFAGKNRGREIIAKVNDIVVVNRLFLVNRKLYMLIISVDFEDFEKEAVKKELSKFLNSFELLKSK